MIRSLKFLGMTAVAALAMGSAMASSASADSLTAEATPVMLTGAQEGTDIGHVDGGETKCTTIKYTGTLSISPATTFALTPTFSGCTFIGLAATMNMNGCSYLFHINSAAGNTSVTTDIVCPAGKEITKTTPSVGTPKCIIHIPAQTGLSGGSAANVGSGATREITVTLNLTGIKYSQTTGIAETGNCPTADNTTNGTYTGQLLLTAESEPSSVHLGIFVS